MAILLTGGAGYIGSHAAVECIDAGYDIIIADNFSNSTADIQGKLEQITGIKIPCYEIDVSDKKALRKLFSENNVDGVIHFAGYKVVGESVEKPLMYYRNNLDTVLTVLEVMREFGCTRIVFSSSAAVYGDSEAPVTEEMQVGRCLTPYGRTKYFIEEILQDAAKGDDSLSAVILRYFNPVGAHESGLIGEAVAEVPSNLMPYISQTAAGIREKVNVFGNDYPTSDGTGVRDYIHVVDLAKGHVAALRYAECHRGSEIFNLGTGNGTSVLELIHTFEKANDLNVPYQIAPRRSGDIAVSYAATDKAENLLCWKAEKSIEDMCRDSWSWQQNMQNQAEE